MNLQIRPALERLLSRLGQPGSGGWRARLAYGAFFAVAFLVAFRQTFPVQALKERLILEASAQGWQVDAADVGPAGLVGMTATGVTLQNRAGTSLALDEVSVSFRILPLLLGRRSVAFDLRLWDGRIVGTADVGGGDRRIELEVSGLDLARAAAVRQAVHLELLGIVSASADLTIPADPAAKPTGRIDLGVAEGGVNGGKLPLPGMATPLTIPRVGLGTVAAQVVLADGKGTFDKLEARDGDAELRGDSIYFVPQARLAASPLYGKLGVRISDAFLDRPGNAAFKGLLDLALRGARGKDGFYELQVYGSLGNPQARPISAGGAVAAPAWTPPAPASAPVPSAAPQPASPTPPAIRGVPGANPFTGTKQRLRRPSPEE